MEMSHDKNDEAEGDEGAVLGRVKGRGVEIGRQGWGERGCAGFRVARVAAVRLADEGAIA